MSNIHVKFVHLLSKIVSISIIVSVITLATSMLAGKIMPIDIFGKFSVYQSVFLILQNLIPVGMGMAIVVYWHKLEDRDFNKLFNFSIFRVVPISVFFLSLLLLIADSIGVISAFYDFLGLLCYSTVQSLLVLSLSLLRTSYDLKQVAIVSLCNAASILLLTFVYFYLCEGSDFFLYFIFQSILSFFVFIYSLKTNFSRINLNLSMSSDCTLSYYRFGIPVAVHALLSSFLVGGDKIIIGLLAENSDVGLYAFSSMAASFFLFIVNNYASSWGVHLSKLIPQLDSVQIKTYYKKHTFYPILFLFFTPPFLLVCIFFDYYYNLGGSCTYYINAIFLIVSYCFYAMTKYYMGYLNCLGNTLMVMRSTIFSCILLVASSVLLFPNFGSVGVSFSVLLAFLNNLVCNIFMSRSVIGRLQ